MGQHRHLWMAWLSHADQNQFSVSRQYSGGSYRSRFGAIPRSGPALRYARHTGVVELLFQESDARCRTLS